MKKFNLKKVFAVVFGFALVIATFVMSICNACCEENDLKSSFAQVRFEDAGKILDELQNSTETIAESYALDAQFPVLSENQTLSSNLCWIFASMKTLETSLMVQKAEYHNFSETATALLNYFYNNGSGTQTVNPMGDFKIFNTIIHDVGLVLESDFSNDKFLDLNKSSENVNFENFEYVKNLANKDFVENLKAVNFGENPVFASLAQKDDKTEVSNLVKKYILKYGGLFVGIEPGMITFDKSLYYPNKQSSSPSDHGFNESHAVCLIGWDERGFKVLNSWGREAVNFSTFYIPYDYDFLYTTLCGFICDDDFLCVKCEESNASLFSKNVMKSDKVLKNIFTVNEEFNLKFSIPQNKDLERAYFKVFSGLTDVTNKFEFEKNDEFFFVKSKSELKQTYSSCYTVKAFIDDELIGDYDFYVYTGTEISYAKFYKNNSDDENIKYVTQLQNTFASNLTTTTFYVNNGGNNNATFRIDIYLPEFSLTSNINAFVGSISEILSDGGKQNLSGISASLQPSMTTLNMYRLSLVNLVNSNEGKLIEIPLTFISNGFTKEYKFLFFIGTDLEMNTSRLFSVTYMLDGGENSSSNLTRFPNLLNSKEQKQFSNFKLNSPKRYDGAEFVGWFDKDGNEVHEINSTFNGDLILYARWKVKEMDFMDVSFEKDTVTHYGESSSETFSGDYVPVYGDSLTFKINYTPKVDELSGYNYYTLYDFLINGHEFKGERFDEAGTKILSIPFKNLDDEKPSLDAGEYEIEVRVTMVVSLLYSYVIKQNINFSVSKREVTAEVLDSQVTYDTNFHAPKVTLLGTFDEDGEVLVDLIDEDGNKSEKNAGYYRFSINEIENPNYAVLNESDEFDFTINPAKCWLDYEFSTFTYNGLPQYPNFIIKNDYNEYVEPVKSFNLDGLRVEPEKCINAGKYQATIGVGQNSNYAFEGGSQLVEFEILRKKITIIFDSFQQRITLSPNNRAKITWKVEGLVGGDTPEMLEVNYSCLGLTATQSGDYEITGSCNNINYDATIVPGTYTILGQYYVFYEFPDGSEYIEIVASGENPKGITRKEHKIPLFSVISYSEELVYNGNDLFIKVSFNNYTWAVIVGIIVFGLVLVYIIAMQKNKKTRNR